MRGPLLHRGVMGALEKEPLFDLGVRVLAMCSSPPPPVPWLVAHPQRRSSDTPSSTLADRSSACCITGATDGRTTLQEPVMAAP